MAIAYRVLVTVLILSIGAIAQDPYKVAGDHYHLQFENKWVRATRVTYGPHETTPVHAHPPTPTTLYIYLTDGGLMRFHHVTGPGVEGVTVDRKPVSAGAMRFAHGAPETHFVEYLGDTPTEYARIELRTDPLDRPTRDVRLPPVHLDMAESAMQVAYENGQVRILRVACAAAQLCPNSDHPDDQAVVVTMSGPHRGDMEWNPKAGMGPLEQVRLELKSKPVKQ